MLSRELFIRLQVSRTGHEATARLLAQPKALTFISIWRSSGQGSILRSVLSYKTQEAQGNNCSLHFHPSTSFHILHRNTTQKQTDRTNRQIILNPSFSPVNTQPNHLLNPQFAIILCLSCSECSLNN